MNAACVVTTVPICTTIRADGRSHRDKQHRFDRGKLRYTVPVWHLTLSQLLKTATLSTEFSGPDGAFSVH